MDAELLRGQGVTPEVSRPAYVEHFALRLGRRATLIPLKEARAYGMLMALSHGELQRLYSGAGLEQYRPEEVLARTLGEAKPVPALCYNLPEAPPASERSAEYAARLQGVLRKLGFPEAYITSLQEGIDMTTNSSTPDYAHITEHQQKTWATGDFSEVARQVVSVSEDLCRAVDPHAGERVLDVACGSGNTALAVARRYCQVSGIDYVPALIERAKVRAGAEGTSIDFRVADAQALPFGEAAFDAVVSVFGVMFAPDQKKAASELIRVCRPGGRIGLACWMPEGIGGAFFGVHGRYLLPPLGL